MLGGWLTGDQHLEADGLRQWVLITNAVTGVVGVRHPVLDLRYQTGFKAEIAEVCQIFQGERHTSILGGRFQTGDFTSDDFLDRTPPRAISTNRPPTVIISRGLSACRLTVTITGSCTTTSC